MSSDPFDAVPSARRDSARSAVREVLGSTPVSALRPVSGGASALVYRIDTSERPYLLRIESSASGLHHRDHYAAMNSAVEAGIAPRLHFANPDQGISVMDFVAQRPLQEYPGGVPTLVRDLGTLVRRLQDSVAFPTPPIFYEEVIRRMFAFLRGSRVFAAGLLDPHHEGLERIAEAYPWNHDARVASHNDPNPRNILFDGTRLWLIDWELGYRNDPITDVAILTHELAGTPELQSELVRSWLGRAPDPATNARLVLMQQLTRLFFACATFRHFAADPNRVPDPDLTALTGAEFVAAIQQGRLRIGTPELLFAWGKMFLAGFRHGLTTPGFEEALFAARQGGVG
jgi:aminoglycoside phosphotransferase (APT) family kinase protein